MQQHHTVLHEVRQQQQRKILMVGTTPDISTICTDCPNWLQKVLLEVVKVPLCNAIALQSKKGVRDTSTENCLSWCEPPVGGFRLFWDFTSPWSAFTCTVIQLRHSFVNMCNCRTPTFSHGHSTALGPHWLRLSSPTCPNKPAQSGPPGGPLAVCIHLGWAMEGPATFAQFPVEEQQCLFTVSPSLDLFQRAERCGRWICSHIQMWRLKHILRRIRKCLKFLSSTPLALR